MPKGSSVTALRSESDLYHADGRQSDKIFIFLYKVLKSNKLYQFPCVICPNFPRLVNSRWAMLDTPAKWKMIKVSMEGNLRQASGAFYKTLRERFRAAIKRRFKREEDHIYS